MASDRVEAATRVEQLREPAGDVPTKDAKPGAAVGEIEKASGIRQRLAETGSRERGCRLIKLALLHERFGKEGGRVSGEASGCSPGLARGQGVAGVRLRLTQVAPPDERLRTKDLDRREGKGRPP